MPVRELNTSTKIETAPAPVKPGVLLYHAPRVSGHSGIALRVARGKRGGVQRTILVVARGPDRKERRVHVSDWPPGEGVSLSDILTRGCVIRDRVKKGLDPYPPDVESAKAEPTLREIWKWYEETHGPNKKPSTRENDKRIWRVHIEPQLGGKLPSDLTYDVLKRWYAAVAKKSIVNANRAYQLVKAVFNAARRKWRKAGKANAGPPEWALANPLDVIGPEDRMPEPERIVVLTPAERERLLACIREYPPLPPQKSCDENSEPGPKWLSMKQSANCLLLIALTGCRKREALDAHWDEFDLDNGYWTIPASRTKQSRMTRIPLLPDALSHIKKLHADRTSDILVFPQIGDATKSQDTLKRTWRTIIKQAKLTAVVNRANGTTSELRIHDLRHNFGTMAVEAGLPLEVVGKLLGHRQISTTQRYAHVHDGVLKAGVKQLAAFVTAQSNSGTNK
jgi:integrase